jgi:protein arginine kinase activator
MQCEVCQQSPASVYVTDLKYQPNTPPGALGEIHTKSVCSSCAAHLGLPHAASPAQNKAVLFKLLQKTAQKSKKQSGLACSNCGLSLIEFRQQGRTGCAECYATFRSHLEPMLLGMHQATRHVGRGPGTSRAESDLTEQISKLRERMDLAIREEDYEDAARLRDELTKLFDQGELK